MEYKTHLCSLVAPICHERLAVAPCSRDCSEIGGVCGKWLFSPEGFLPRTCSGDDQFCKFYLPYTTFTDAIPTDTSLSGTLLSFSLLPSFPSLLHPETMYQLQISFFCIADLGDLSKPILWALAVEFLFFISSFFLAVLACIVYKVVDVHQQKKHSERARAMTIT